MGGVKVVVCKTGWVGEGVVLHVSTGDTGNVNADFNFMIHNRYSVLNGPFVRQIHPSSLPDKKCIWIHSYIGEAKNGQKLTRDTHQQLLDIPNTIGFLM